MFKSQVPELQKHEPLPAFRCRCASAYVPPAGAAGNAAEDRGRMTGRSIGK